VREGARTRNTKRLRTIMTDAEKRLWYRLRRRQLANQRFRRQVPIGTYIVDFACVEAMLIVEVDGSQHLESATDRARDRWLQGEGYRVLRFWNDDVLARTEGVMPHILDALGSNRPLPHSGHAGEGTAGSGRG